ncbi:hypothetical protein VB264_22730 [Arcicella aquatica]|uniref:Uncharacterized protein n=1 Tax=Arcicella aquatica TaxID=217141 RepID=A0ABU5QWC7_9BACT|nr:hypothetical protein [Arcicella aquatica]MEA5260631.1 hypothetical protein [Arcicella aquatica]
MAQNTVEAKISVSNQRKSAGNITRLAYPNIVFCEPHTTVK